MGYLEQFAVAADIGFQQRVEVAILLASTQIQGEAFPGKQMQWRKRADLALSVSSGRGPVIGVDGTVVVSWVLQFARVIAAVDATFVLPTTDTDDAKIQGHVTANWDNLAGVSGEDLQAQ